MAFDAPHIQNTRRGGSIRFFGKKNAQDHVRVGLEPLYPRLWRYALTTTGRRDWADDLAQTTCERALAKASQFTPGTHLDRWLFTLAHSIWRNELRARRVRTGMGLIPVEKAALPSHGLSAETNLFCTEVLSKVSALPEAQRLAVLLVYVEGYSYAEAATVMDVPVGTIMSRLATARARLGHLHDGADGDLE